ncbi:MAG: DUF4271 domain-containing protein [Pricia sp.]
MDPILRTAGTPDWITILLLSSILLPVIAKSLFYSRFLNFIILPFNNKYIFMYNKKEKLINWFHLCFTLFQIINFSLFVFLAGNIIFQTSESIDVFMYPVILGSILGFISLKVVLQLGNGFIFGSNKTVSELIFKKFSYLNYTGIVMFLANLMLAYVTTDSLVVIFVTVFTILAINVIGWVTLLRNHQKFITNYFFYFILYLCALEISPLIIIGSYLKN